MTMLIEKSTNFSVAAQPHPRNDMKLKLARQVAVSVECTCTTQHMSVHDAMCPNCWARLMERNGN